MKLSDEQVEAHLATVPEWQLKGRSIFRRYGFKKFMDGIAFTNRIAEIAESLNHHPFISIDYTYVTVTLTSWHARGLTSADFAQALVVDNSYRALMEASEQNQL